MFRYDVIRNCHKKLYFMTFCVSADKFMRKKRKEKAHSPYSPSRHSLRPTSSQHIRTPLEAAVALCVHQEIWGR